MKPLDTKRCTLSKICEKDIDEAVRVYTDEKARAFLGGVIPRAAAEEKLHAYVRENREVFCVRLKDQGQFLGLIYVTPYHEDGCYELSYVFLPEFWNQGYAFETVKEILQYCKTELHFAELVSETQTRNLASRKLLEKLGYRFQKEVVRFEEQQSVYQIRL